MRLAKDVSKHHPGSSGYVSGLKVEKDRTEAVMQTRTWICNPFLLLTLSVACMYMAVLLSGGAVL